MRRDIGKITIVCSPRIDIYIYIYIYIYQFLVNKQLLFYQCPSSHFLSVSGNRLTVYEKILLELKLQKQRQLEHLLLRFPISLTSNAFSLRRIIPTTYKASLKMGQGLGQDMAKLLKSILNMKYIPFFFNSQ